MAFDPMYAGGSGPNEPWCMSCKAPIAAGERSVRVTFNHDPHGHRGLTGPYHERCSKPFASMAYAINVLSSRPF
jgi:hypothetical protein